MGKKLSTKWSRRQVGNINLKGKKSCLLYCMCCSMFNFKDYNREQEDKKYIAEEIIEHDLSH